MNWVAVSIAGLGVVLVVAVVIWDVWAFFNSGPKRFPIGEDNNHSNPKLQKYLRRWIGQPGQVAVFSNDLTWVENDIEMKQLFHSKASRDELTLCICQRNVLVKELEAAGAKVHTYGQLVGFSPQARFTIRHWHTAGSEVTIGYPDGSVQICDQARGNSAHVLASDLVQIIKALP